MIAHLNDWVYQARKRPSLLRVALMDKPVVVDIFCGVGGLSLGFEQAGLPVALAADVESVNVRTYKKNFPQSAVICTDLSTTTGRELVKNTELEAADIDIVIGGPPCQGFSMIGSRRVDDPRNRLIFDFLRLCSELRAPYFVMENVPGLMLGKMEVVFSNWLAEARKLGYSVVQPVWKLNANDFGVPQNRRRCFAVGFRLGFPPPAHPQSSLGCNRKCQLRLMPTVSDAIDDLPDPRRFNRLLRSDRVSADFGQPSTYARYMRGECTDLCDKSENRPFDARALTGSKRTVHTERSKRRFQRTEAGATEPVSRFPKLDPNGVAPTLRAGTRFQSSGYTAARPIHPDQPRCITVREAARLQSFPDWFEFDPTIWHGFRQVGNAVPPNLARAVGLQIVAAIARKNADKSSDFDSCPEGI